VISMNKLNFNLIGFILSLPILFISGYLGFGIYKTMRALADLFKIQSLGFDIFMICLFGLFTVIVIGLIVTKLWFRQ